MESGEFRRARGPLPSVDGPTWWFVRSGRALAVLSAGSGGDGVLAIPLRGPGTLTSTAGEAVLIGYRGEAPCLAASVAEGTPAPEGAEWRDLFRLHGHLDDVTYAFACYAYQVAHWHATSAYCPVCGGAATLNEVDWGRTCTRCGHVGYPRVSPCIIVLVHDGGRRVLLARQASWARGMYSLVAGFVEPAESLEACLRREVREEIGVEVDEITYTGSQPWSFPHQVMVGFTARYAGGELRIDPAELEDAGWFDVAALPSLPPPQSIARRILEAHVGGVLGAQPAASEPGT